MATLTLDQSEIESLEEQLQRKTNLPWKFTSCLCTSPDYTPIFSFSYEMEIGPEDIEPRSKVCVKAQSDSRGGPLNLYAIHLEGDAMEALQILDMMRQRHHNPS